MTKKQENVPDYEVEFIPVERRLTERRSGGLNPPFPGERRNRGRRAEDENEMAPEESTLETGGKDRGSKKPTPGKQ